MIDTRSRFTPALTLCTICVLIGLGNLPYGYYVLLRLLLCGVSLILLIESMSSLQDWQRWLLGGAAVLYNPFVPIVLGDKGLWIVLNLGTLTLFWSVGGQLGRAFPTRSASNTEERLTPSARTSPASANRSTADKVKEIDATAWHDAPAAAISTRWRCRSCNHQWTFDRLDWERPCPSCHGTLFVRSLVSADGRTPTIRRLGLE